MREQERDGAKGRQAASTVAIFVKLPYFYYHNAKIIFVCAKTLVHKSLVPCIW